MRNFQRLLLQLLLVCVGLRLAAWLVEPVIGLLAVLFGLTVVFGLIFGRHRGL